MTGAVDADQTSAEAAHMSRPPVRALGRAGTVLAAIGGLMLLAMMGLTVCDVIGRYVFSAPIKGAAELTEILLAATIFLGLGAVSLREDHVTVDLLTERMPARVQPLRQALTGLFSGVVLGVVAWRLWVHATQIGGYGGTTASLGIPVAPLAHLCAICSAVGAVITTVIPLRRFVARRLS
jgi:TRAP-type transport system small permease protein